MFSKISVETNRQSDGQTKCVDFMKDIYVYIKPSKTCFLRSFKYYSYLYIKKQKLGLVSFVATPLNGRFGRIFTVKLIKKIDSSIDM